jgi:hypothetical protein
MNAWIQVINATFSERMNLLLFIFLGTIRKKILSVAPKRIKNLKFASATSINL